MVKSLSFCLSVKLLISPSYLNEFFSGYSNVGCRFFSHHFKYVLPFPSGLKSFYWKISCYPYRNFFVSYLLLLVFVLCVNLINMYLTQVQFLGQEDLLEKEMATHSSILAWKIPWMEEPGRLRSMGWTWLSDFTLGCFVLGLSCLGLSGLGWLFHFPF